MLFVGVDIAKSKHTASISNHLGEVIIKPFDFSNDLSGFNSLLEILSQFDKDELLIGLESTAHYGEVFIQFFFDKGFNVAIVNPLQTSAIRKAGIRKTKNDKVDSFIIAKSLMFNGFNILKKKDIEIISLRNIARTRRNLVKQRTKSKIQLVAYIDQIFPEIANFFNNNLHINTAYKLLAKYTTPDQIKDLHLTKLTNLLKKASKGKYNKQKAILLKKLADNSVGLNSPTLSLQIKMAIQQIELLNEQIKQVEKQSEEILNRLNPIILTIPGISFNSAAAILGIIGDFTRFSSPDKLLAFAGLDPVVYQSGNFKAKTTRMSKRGNSLLRKHLILAAFNLTLNNKVFKDYYDSKRMQGKSHYNALGHTAGKLIRILFKMHKDNVAFNL